MNVEKPLLYYENKHNIKYPNFTIKVIKRENKYIYFETKFGLCKKVANSFGKSNYSIDSSTNKTEYLQLQLKSKYGDKFDYSLVKYTNNLNDNIDIICREHGIFKINIYSILRRKGNCPICCKKVIKLKKSHNIKTFIQKANLIHNYKYNYSKTIYNGSVNNLKIICKLHGEFEQNANRHLQGDGCKLCANIKNSERNSNKVNLWTHTGWSKSAIKSKYFDSFKVYIIKCWNNGEVFYKIGKTYLKIKQRFESKRQMPYEWKLIKIYEGNSKEICILENKLKEMNKENKYIPKIGFGGKQECFIKIKKYEGTD